MIYPSGKTFLRVTNPRNSGVSPMEVIGSCLIPMAFSPVDRVFRISFRIVGDLPYAVVLGASSMKEHQRTISFRENEGFRPTPESTRVPFSRHTTNSATASKDVTAAWTAFCAIRTTADNDPNLEDPRHFISKCLTEANEDSLDQVVDHLRSTLRITEEKRRSHAATVNASRNAFRKEKRQRQLAEAGAKMAEAGTTSALVNKPPPNLQPGGESHAHTQTRTHDPIMGGAVWEDA